MKYLRIFAKKQLQQSLLLNNYYLSAMSRFSPVCLLIDDSYIDNYINRKMLESNLLIGDIIVNQNPVDALESLKSHRVDPDIIFLDIAMPVMDGFQFLDAYDRIDIDKDKIKIIMISSSIDPEEIKRSEENKYVSRFVSKALTSALINELVA